MDPGNQSLRAIRLAIVFASFGLNAPRNGLSYTTIVLGGISIASAIFVILELDTPFGGLFTVSSRSMRDAFISAGSVPSAQMETLITR